MEDLPEALLGVIIKRLTRTSDLNSLSLVSKRLYTIEAELRDSIYVGCGLALKALALSCPMLQSFELTFYGCEPDWPEIGFTQEGLVMLIQSCPIRDLSLGGANIFDDEGMKALSCARFLESLKLVSCIAITDAGLRLLACSPCLINLTLGFCDGLTDDGLGEVVHSGKLESLVIEKCSGISLRAVQGAAKSVRYTDDDCPDFKEWMERCVYGREVC